MPTYTYGNQPGAYIEVPGSPAGQVQRPATGTAVQVLNDATGVAPTVLTGLDGVAISQVVTTDYGYIGFKTDCPSVRVSADGVNWWKLYSSEAMDAAIVASESAAAALAASEAASTAAAQAASDAAEALALATGSTTNVVDTVSAQVIGGTKTFSASPLVPTPADSATSAAASVAYVQAKVAAVSGGGTGDSRYVDLDSFAGADDETKLTAAWTYLQAQTYRPTLRFGPRQYNFTATRTVFPGLRMEGAPGYGNAEKSAVNRPTEIKMNGSSLTWLDVAGGSSIFDVYIGQLTFVGKSTVQFMGSSDGTALYCTLMRDLSFSGFKSVMGSQSVKLLMTASTFDGYWEVNNSYNGAFHIGGSDNTLWVGGGMLLDSGTAFNSGSVGQSHLWLDYLEKTVVGPLYITGESGWGGIKVTGPAYNAGGSNLGGPLFLTGLRLEGRNAGAPCYGALLRQEGGSVVLRDSWVGYGMSAPGSMTGRSPVDAGVVHVTSGALLVDGCFYDRATAVAESTPFVYAGGTSTVRVSNVLTGSKGGTWSGKPRVTNGGSASVTVDSSVTLA